VSEGGIVELGMGSSPYERRELLLEGDWRERSARHEAYMGSYIDAHRERRASRKKHPVHDFLFEYYQCNRSVVRLWRPAAAQALLGQGAEVYLNDERYHRDEYGVGLNLSACDEQQRERLDWLRRLIRSARSRPSRFNCFGLHEWAMLYRSKAARHEHVPLRLSSEEIDRCVRRSVIRCSHFDAFRFFTPAARGLNELLPSRSGRLENEQFGCIHFNMDLYRWCYKSSPWVGSDLLRECFALALEARELDMRASPYDLSEYGYDPIAVETPEGRERYAFEQAGISRRGMALGERLLRELDFALAG